MTAQSDLILPEERGNYPARVSVDEATSTDTNVLSLIRVAVNKGVDIAQLDRLVALHERIEAGNARKAFARAMSAFSKSPPIVEKHAEVKFVNNKKQLVNYRYADKYDVVGSVKPALAEHGFSFDWEVKQDNVRVWVACVLTHDDGHEKRVEMNGPVDMSGGKNEIQGNISSKTYLERETLLAVTGLAAKGVDDDGRLGAAPNEPPREASSVPQIERINPQQCAWIATAMLDLKIDKSKLLAWVSEEAGFAISKVQDIPASLGERVYQRIERKRAGQASSQETPSQPDAPPAEAPSVPEHPANEDLLDSFRKVDSIDDFNELAENMQKQEGTPLAVKRALMIAAKEFGLEWHPTDCKFINISK